MKAYSPLESQLLALLRRRKSAFRTKEIVDAIYTKRSRPVNTRRVITVTLNNLRRKMVLNNEKIRLVTEGTSGPKGKQYRIVLP